MFDITSIISDSFRGIIFFLCESVYSLIIYALKLFMYVGTARPLQTDIVELIYKRIWLILGIFMLFRLTFTFIQMLVSPSMILDSDKGVGSIIKKIILIIILLAITPTLFKEAYVLQSKIVESDIISRIILGTSNSSIDNYGPQFSHMLFSSFYYKEPSVNYSGGICTDNFYEHGLPEQIYETNSISYASNCLNEKSGEKYVTHFDGITALLVGGFVLWVLVMYVVTLGMRVAKLAFLEIIAPIPIISHLTPGKQTPLSKWGKQCLMTFLDLFVRITIISFALLLIIQLSESNIDDLLGVDATIDESLVIWVKIVIILGILLFAKKAPDLIKEIFPGLGGAGLDLGFGLKSRTDFAGKSLITRTTAAGLGMATVGALGLAHGLTRKKLNNNSDNGVEYKTKFGQNAAKVVNGIGNTSRTIGSGMSGMMAGALRGGYQGFKGGKLTSGITKGVASQAKANIAYNKWAENGGQSYGDRFISGMAPKLGFDTPYDSMQKANEATIKKANEELERVNKVIGEAHGLNDSYVNSARGKVTSREATVKLGDNNLARLVNSVGIDLKTLDKMGITSNTNVGDVQYLISKYIDGKNEELKKLNENITDEMFIRTGKKRGRKNGITTVETFPFVDQNAKDNYIKEVEKKRQQIMEELSKIDKSSIIEKELGKIVVDAHVKGQYSNHGLTMNLDKILYNAKNSIEVLNSTGNNNDALIANNLKQVYEKLEDVKDTGDFNKELSFEYIDKDGNKKKESFKTADQLVDYLSNTLSDVTTDKQKEIYTNNEKIRQFNSREDVASAKADSEYNKK